MTLWADRMLHLGLIGLWSECDRFANKLYAAWPDRLLCGILGPRVVAPLSLPCFVGGLVFLTWFLFFLHQLVLMALRDSGMA